MTYKKNCYYLVFSILLINCTESVKNNVSIDIGNNVYISIYAGKDFTRKHAKFPSDYDNEISKTMSCDEFYLDTVMHTWFVMCYESENDTLSLNKEELQELKPKILSKLMIGQYDTKILETVMSDKNNVYTIYVTYSQYNSFHAELYKYSERKIVNFSFHNFNNLTQIEDIIKSIKFE